jgi:hypothetical protein
VNILCLDGRNTFLSLHGRVGHLYVLTASPHTLLVALRFNAVVGLGVATFEAVGAGGCIRQRAATDDLFTFNWHVHGECN